MKWSEEAEKAVSKVPFFVRGRVKRRVEEEAVRSNSTEVRLEHVKTCQRRFLENMEEEVKGYQVETCFGASGCPNRAVADQDFTQKVEALLCARDLKSFLRERVQGPLKLHHEFRISVSDCPNACSRPQIVDLGLIGARRPKAGDAPCSQCGSCVEICREGAMTLSEKGPIINVARCLACGQCISSCPTGTLQESARGYRVLVGGKLGRHARLGQELPGIHPQEEALKVIDQFLDLYQKHCAKGERLGEIMERIDRRPMTGGKRKVENR